MNSTINWNQYFSKNAHGQFIVLRLTNSPILQFPLWKNEDPWQNEPDYVDIHSGSGILKQPSCLHFLGEVLDFLKNSQVTVPRK